MSNLSKAWWRRLGVAGCVCLLAACGGGGGGQDASDTGGAAIPTGDWFPLANGHFWRYAQDGRPVEVRLGAERAVSGGTAWPSTMRFLDAPGTPPLEGLYTASASSVRFLGSQSADPDTRSLGDYDILRLPLQQGKSWQLFNLTKLRFRDFDDDGTRDNLTLQADATVVGLESVASAAGNFAQAVRVRTVQTQVATLSRTGALRTIASITTDDWYALGIGLVKSTTTTTGANGASSTNETVLSAYRVGGQRSDTTAPQVTARSPAPGSLSASAVLRVGFSEPMDSSVAAGIALTDSNGRAVAAVIRWADDSTAVLEPQARVSSGRYTVNVASPLVDAFGNAVVPANWTLDIDADGPAATSYLPMQDSRGASLTPTIVVTFDEVPDANATRIINVSLRDEIREVPVEARLVGRELRIEPGIPLRRGLRHEVYIGGVRDALGNASAPIAWAFTTDEGRFERARELPGLGFPSGVAAADLDRDGRLDLVARAIDPIDAFFSDVWLLRQGSDGRLQPAVRLPTDRNCTPDGIAVSDVDADGRPDIVVSQLRCPPVWLRQLADGGFANPAPIGNQRIAEPSALPVSADGGRSALISYLGDPLGFGIQPGLWMTRQSTAGSFDPPVEIETGDVLSWRIGDLDGDGRPDLVTVRQVGADERLLRIRLQRADGSFPVASEIRLSEPISKAPVLADMNRDGRLDLVVLRGGSALRAPGVLHQRPDGGFDPVVWLVAGNSLNAEQLAVGDFNGDGRADLVAAESFDNSIEVRLQRADGGFEPAEVYEAPGRGGGLEVGDFNGDGRPDVLLGGWLRTLKPMPPAAASARLPGVQALGLPRSQAQSR